jgi:hypothetical protein
MKTFRYTTTFLFLVIFGLHGCKQSSPFPGYKPPAIGNTNHVDFVMDSVLAKGMVGDSVLEYFTSPFPVMPAPEPFFDLRFLTMTDIEYDAYKKELKTLIFVADLTDTTSLVTKMVKKDLGSEKWNKALTDSTFFMTFAKDKWAKGQLLIYIFAQGSQKLADIMPAVFPAAAARINKHDEPSLEASVYGVKGKDNPLTDLVQSKYGLKMAVPPGFVKALEEDNFLWLRFDDKKSIQNIVVQKFAYTDVSQFSKANMIKLRDEYGKKYVKTNSEDAYMQTNPIDLPVYEYEVNHHGMVGKEIRGIWETVNDFMGGPFFSYLLLNKATNELVFIDVFILAPGEDKRDMMQRLDYVVKKSTF